MSSNKNNFNSLGYMKINWQELFQKFYKIEKNNF